MSVSATLSRRALAVKTLRGVCQDPFVLLLDQDHFGHSLQSCRQAFPAHWHHCFAIKANPTRLVLVQAGESGFGFEAASLGELRMAKRADSSAFVVYDSPLKLEHEIRESLAGGAHLLNVDNLQELEVVSDIAAELGVTKGVGIRVNPQVGAGSLAGFSTGTLTSKFGIGLRDDEGIPIMDAYKRHSWLTAIMCHVGSQGVSFDLMIAGIRATVDFAKRVNAAVGRNQIDTVDIGGGLSVNFASDDINPTFDEYASALKEAVPELFDPAAFKMVVTEFGRALVAKSGFFASRIEYCKTTGGRRIAIQHAGADTCVRTVYHPKEWPLRLSVLDKELRPFAGEGFVVNDDADTSNWKETDIAGPCCIQADIVAHQRLLPELHRGDTVLLHDVGGYYHSGKTTYNLRQSPSVWGFRGPQNDGQLEVELLQQAETIDHTLDQFDLQTTK